MRLVRKDCGDGFSEFIADARLVFFVRYLNELVYCFFFENVYICLTVEAGVVGVVFKIGKIFSAFGFVAYATEPVRYKVSVAVK